MKTERVFRRRSHAIGTCFTHCLDNGAPAQSCGLIDSCLADVVDMGVAQLAYGWNAVKRPIGSNG